MGSYWITDATSIFIECEVTTVVQAVFNRPVPTNEMRESIFVCFVRKEAGNAVCDFISSRTVWQDDFALNGKDLGRVREIDLLGFDGACNQPA